MRREGLWLGIMEEIKRVKAIRIRKIRIEVRSAGESSCCCRYYYSKISDNAVQYYDDILFSFL